MKQVILFPIPGAGHMNPMFHVAEALHSRGISITFILTNFNSPNTSDYPADYTFHFIDAGLKDMVFTDSIAWLAALNSNVQQPFRECLGSVLGDEGGEESIACLITDPLWRCTRVVCKEFALPRIMVHTSTVADLVILSSDDAFQHEDYSHFPIVIEMVEEIKASSGVICNSFEELEGPSLKKLENLINIPIFPIGPLHKYSKTSATNFLIKDKTPIISWLDTQQPKSVIYVSFGSVATITKPEFDEIASGLAQSNHTFLWVVRPGLVQGHQDSTSLVEDFVKEVGERGLVVQWAPQQEVLAHVAIGGALIHGGWNSALESISEGVPAIIMPLLFPDQKTIAKHVTDVWKMGLRVEKGSEKAVVTEAIVRLMGDGNIRHRADALKASVDTCLANGGSSYKSLEKLSSFILSL